MFSYPLLCPPVFLCTILSPLFQSPSAPAISPTSPRGPPASSNALSLLHFNHSPLNLHLCTWPQASHFHARETLLCFVLLSSFTISGVPARATFQEWPHSLHWGTLLHSVLTAVSSFSSFFILFLVTFYWNKSFHVGCFYPTVLSLVPRTVWAL